MIRLFQNAKIPVNISGNIGKYDFLTRKDAAPKRDVLEKAATMKRFEYSPLGKEL